MTDSTATQTRPELVEEDECPCARLLSVTREIHDRLLGFEQRGLAGAIGLLMYAYDDEDSGGGLGQLSWHDLPQFVALHGWEHPADVCQFVDLVIGEIDGRRRSFKARLALESILTVATTALNEIKP